MKKTHWLVAACAGMLCFWACAADTSHSSNNDRNDVGAGGASSSNGAGGGEATVTVASGAGGGQGCPHRCSADLKSIIDCKGVILDTCPGEQACLDAVCVDDACSAAEASKSSRGCDYWALQPDTYEPYGGGCFAVYIANTWSVPVHIDVSRHGQSLTDTGFIRIPNGQGQYLDYDSYDPVAGLPVGEVAILFMAHQTPDMSVAPPCPVPTALNEAVSVTGTGRGHAFNIVTDQPVVAYSIYPYGGGQAAITSSSLLLPTSAWDDNYIAVNAYKKSEIVQQGRPSLDIVAAEPNTTVTILPKVPIVGGGGVSPASPNQPIQYHLEEGQYLQIAQSQELTGSVVQADKPIGLWGAANCFNVPANLFACDSGHQQIPPVKALGSRYAAVRHRNRKAADVEETPPWRIVGAVDGTLLYWTPNPPLGAPAMINQGEVVEFITAGPFVVESQDDEHPFYVAQYMESGHAHIPLGEGDAEWVNVIPVDQFLDNYVFFTDPTYPETNLVVVRRRSQATGEFEDVELDCAGALTDWKPIGDFEYTRISLVTGNFFNVGNCSNGRHEITSKAPFGVTVWGWGTGDSNPVTLFVSYAYPAGAGVQSINDVVVPPTPN